MMVLTVSLLYLFSSMRPLQTPPIPFFPYSYVLPLIHSLGFFVIHVLDDSHVPLHAAQLYGFTAATRSLESQ